MAHFSGNINDKVIMAKENLTTWELEELILYATGKTEQEVENMINDMYDLEEYTEEF